MTSSSPASSSFFRSSSPSPGSQSDEVVQLKRKLLAAQSEIVTLSGKKRRTVGVTPQQAMGRGIRRLVALFDTVHDLIDESLHRGEDEDGMELATFSVAKQRAHKRLYDAYDLLRKQVPEFRAIVHAQGEVDQLDSFVAQLQIGANDARSDDLRHVKEDVAIWLNCDFAPVLPFEIRSRADRGFGNDITGCLLCPINLNWDDDNVRASIRTGVTDISSRFFLRCLYPQGGGSPNNFDRGYLRSGLLVKTFCAIFTSPSSSDAFEADAEQGPSRKSSITSRQKKATKCNNATLLHMDSQVTPCSIAYSAVLLVTNLSDSTQWTEVHNGFSYCAFYDYLVDYLTNVSTPRSKAHIDSLIDWWNMCVFPNRVMAMTGSETPYDELEEQRARREAEGAEW